MSKDYLAVLMKITGLTVGAILVIVLAVLQISHVLNFSGLWLIFACLPYLGYWSSQIKKEKGKTNF